MSPMFVEVCATCGCSESAHLFGVCDESCADDCDGSHPDDDQRVECECGNCDAAVWLEDPDEILCVGAARERSARDQDETPGPTTLPIDLPHRVTVSGFDTPLTIIASLEADHDGRPVRRDGVPARGTHLFLVYATTDDDLELALPVQEVVTSVRQR